MTPRRSVRAAARERYGELKRERRLKAALSVKTATPLPNPPPQGGREHALPGEREQAAASGEGAAAPQDLTARIRALYEDTSVPVREIAAIAGVTERTLYKYVEKHGWTKRYHVLPRGREAAAHNRGRRWLPTTGVVPAKGAGGRFTRREDIGKPFATGLKALDAAGRAHAHAACDAVEPFALLAQKKAELEEAQAEVQKAFKRANKATDELQKYRGERRAHKAEEERLRNNPSLPRPQRSEPFIDSDEIENGYARVLAAYTNYLHDAQRWRDSCAAALAAAERAMGARRTD